MENKADGVVFARCPDGDSILLPADGSVVRFSHEVPEIIQMWPSAEQFFHEAIDEDE